MQILRRRDKLFDSIDPQIQEVLLDNLVTLWLETSAQNKILTDQFYSLDRSFRQTKQPKGHK